MKVNDFVNYNKEDTKRIYTSKHGTDMKKVDIDHAVRHYCGEFGSQVDKHIVIPSHMWEQKNTIANYYRAKVTVAPIQGDAIYISQDMEAV